LYETYSSKVDKIDTKPRSRKSIPHSMRKHNPEGKLEVQIKMDARSQAGINSKFKKRHMKELSPTIRDNIVRMYLVDHVFQKDIASYYKISTNLVSKLVR